MVVRVLRLNAALILMCLLGACTMAHEQYLDDHLGQATQRDVAEDLGPPSRKQALDNGQSMWTYKEYSSEESRTSSTTDPGQECHEYDLTFDESDMLRSWVKRDC
ncbi:MAG: hypothetical protein ACT4OO_06980 [Nitrospiraceae bacterium]